MQDEGYQLQNHALIIVKFIDLTPLVGIYFTQPDQTGNIKIVIAVTKPLYAAGTFIA